MKSDEAIKQNVQLELRWNPDIDTTDVAIAVKDGVVSLTGFMHSYAQKRKAETTAKRVGGVVGIANDVEVRLPIIHSRPDPEIARDVVAMLRSELPHIAGKIKVTVRDGQVTLDGELQWHFQRKRAEEAADRPKGVKSVINNIVLGPRIVPGDIKSRIEDAIRRSAVVEAQQICVEVNGGTVTLSGAVHSWAELEEAERVAWAAPGVVNVDTRIQISPEPFTH